MADINPKPTSKAEWYDTVVAAQDVAGYQFDESVQSYLVLTLDHFTTQSGLASGVLALDFLEHAMVRSSYDLFSLRSVGDQCLILSGLFPGCALKKNVSLHYLVGIGRQAYNTIALVEALDRYDPELFNKLCSNFVGLIDVLHHIRFIDKPDLIN